MSNKRFTVLLHFEGERRLERDVLCHSVNDMLNQLERRIGYRIKEAHFFNPYLDAYQLLTPNDFETMPRNCELQIFFDSDRRDVGPTTTQMASNKHSLTYKARIIECLRKQLLPLYNSRFMSKDEMIATCSQLCSEYIDRRGLQDPELASTKKDLSLREQDLLRQMVKAYKQAAFPDHDDAPSRVNLVDRGDHAPSQRYTLQNGTGTTTRTRGVRPTSGTTGSIHQRLYEGRPASPRVGAASSTASGSQRGRGGVPSHKQLFPQGPNYTRNSVGYFKNPSDQHYQRTPSPSRSPMRAASPQSVTSEVPYTPATDSLFQSVSYTVAGTFPSIPPGNARIGDSNLRCSLSAPTLSDAEQDVVVTGNVHTASSVSLCWWLAYGPQRIVLNLDKMYTSHFVTTYQVSDSAFILAFRSGSLVPGWEYFVHLTITSATGTTAMAQTSFVVPSIGGDRHPGIGSAASANEMVRGSGGLTSKYNSKTMGYMGDAERGRLQRQSPDRTASPDPVATGDSTTRSESTLHQAASQPLQMQFIEGGGTVGGRTATEATNTSAGSVTSPLDTAAGTYQDQLRAFFTNQIEPLYFLSSNPSMTEEEFKGLVKDVAKRFWFRHPSEHQLDDATKKEIVKDVKQHIGSTRAKQGVGSIHSLPTVSTATSPPSVRKVY